MDKYCVGVMGVKKHVRSVWLNDAGDALCWGPEGCDSEDSKVKAMAIDSFHTVDKGAAGVASTKGNDDLCLHVLAQERELDLEFQSTESRDAWVRDLYCVCYSSSLKVRRTKHRPSVYPPTY